MSRNITTAQKRARDFHKSDALAQTNQIKYDCFFCLTQKTCKFIYSRSKIRNRNPGSVFFDFILLFNVPIEKFSKKIVWLS